MTYAGSGAQNINPLPPPALISLDPACTRISPLPHRLHYANTLIYKGGFDAIIYEQVESETLQYCGVLTNSDTGELGWHQCNAGGSIVSLGIVKEDIVSERIGVLVRFTSDSHT